MANQLSEADVVTVTAYEARSLLCSGHRYLDVRMAEDFEKGHVEGADNVPYYSSVSPQGLFLGRVKNPEFVEQVSALYSKDEVFIVGCRTGVRSKHATVDLHNAGFRNVKNMGGGFLAWLESTSQS